MGGERCPRKAAIPFVHTCSWRGGLDRRSILPRRTSSVERTFAKGQPCQNPFAHGPRDGEDLTGNAGLDDILGGGFDADRVYLIEGRPGTGKTTLALQFLLEGIRFGERCLYVTLSESERELRAVVGRHGWTLSGIDVFELMPPEASLDRNRS